MTDGGLVAFSAAMGVVGGFVAHRAGARVNTLRTTQLGIEGDALTGQVTISAHRDVAPPRARGALASIVVASVGAGLLAARFGDGFVLVAYWISLMALVASAVADLRVGLLPRRFIYPGWALSTGLLACSALIDDHHHAFVDAFVGSIAAGALFSLIWLVYPRGMGFGDVRLAGYLGLLLGWRGFGAEYLGFVAALALGALMGVVLLAQGHGRKTAMPFGPALCLGAGIGVLWGPHLAQVFFHSR